MRHVCLATLAVTVSTLVPGALLGQSGPLTGGVQPQLINPSTLTITNYQMVGQPVPYTRTLYYYTYSASLINTGPATPEITATVTSLLSSATVVSGKGNLHFPPAATNVIVSSLNTFTLLVDRTANFGFNALSWSYNAPVANAGPAQTAAAGTTVTLNGSGSTNPSGIGTLTYNWALTTLPAGSLATLTNPASVTPTFVPDIEGNYIITLTVSNGAGSDTSTVAVNVNSPPPAPVASAGPNQMVAVGVTVHLDGSQSRDFNNQPLTYSWTLVQRPPGSNAVLTGANTVSPSFVADVATTSSASYVAQLVVNDSLQNSAPSMVTITTTPAAPPPTANAGQPQTVSVGASVQLDGSKSADSNGNPLTYQWSLITLPSGSNAKLSNATLVNPTFVADVAGQYVAQLIVNDGVQNSLPSTVMITVNPATVQPPVASAGPAQTVQIGAAAATPVMLSGSGTDPQSLPLTYHWTLITAPGSSAVLSNPNIANPTFTPDKIGQYTATLIVNNGSLNSNPSSVIVTVVDSLPIANAGPAQNVTAGAKVTLDGSGSSDSNNAPLTYSWSLLTVPQGSTATLTGANTVSPAFVADMNGSYVAQLIVNDGVQNSVPSTVMITASPQNTITLSPNPLNLINSPANLTVTLGAAAGTNGQVVTFTVVDTTVATALATVTVPPGMTTTTAPISPVNLGSTNIFASASGFQPGIATINVVPATITLTLGSSAVGVGNTVTGTIALNSPAPAAGLNVSLALSQTGFVSLSTATVNIAGGSASGTFTVTGGPTAGGPTTITASAAGYTSSQAAITSVTQGSISVQSGLTVAPGQTLPITISVGPTPAPNNVTITLASSDTTKLTVTPSIVIPAGSTTATTPAQVTGVNFGSATITATATGYVSGNANVNVAANLTFSPQTLTLATGGSTNLTLTLSSGAAPANGIIVTLASDAMNIATVPPTVTIPQGQNTATVPVTGGVAGTAHITASSSVAGIANGTATVNVVTGLAIATASPLPAGIVNTPYSTTVMATGGTTPYTWSATGLPAGLAINSSTGAISGTPTATGTSNAVVTVKDSSSPQLTASATYSITITAPLTITTTSPLISGAVNTPYTATVSATGGTNPYTWSAIGLPAGLTINSTTGVISGTPTASGTSVATVTVKDSSSPQLTATVSASITIVSQLSITTASPLPTGIVNTNYAATVAAAGGTNPYTWSATGLPAGLTINAGTGAISGTPTGPAGTSTANITVKDSSNPQQTATASLSITIVSQLAISTTSPLPSGVVNTPYTATVAATGGTTPYTFTATGLPAGLGINSSTGVISGTPTANGTSSATVAVKDSTNPQQTASATFSITIGNVLVITTQSPLPQGIVSIAYNTTVMAAGGVTPYTFSATGLPAGLSINASTGVISGTPTTAGAGSATITVKDSGSSQQTANASLLITITAPLTITTVSPLPQGNVNTAYTAPVAATGGTTPYTFSATGLPAGLSINTGTGVISGTPTTPGTSNATVTVKDAGNPQQTANATLSIVIVSQLAITTTSPLPSGTVNTAYSTPVAATGGSTPYTFSATGLPAGLSINSGTGVISGTPTGPAGPSSATVTVKDSGSPQQTANATLSITINSQLIITTTSPLTSGIVNAAYSANVAATGGTTPYTFSATGLPAGLSINAGTGVIGGTPTAPGTSNATVTVKDASNPQQTASANLSITIAPQLTITTASPLPSGTVNVVYNATVMATGGATPYIWSATGLPAGLGINSGTGVISGTPTATGTSNATVTVKDSGSPQQIASATLSITINATPLTITTPSPLPGGAENMFYSQSVSATGGTTPYIYSASGLPVGLSINATTGGISGTPSLGTAGMYTVNVTVKDSGSPQQTANASLSLTIAPANSNFLAINGGTVGMNLAIPLTVTLSTGSLGSPVQIASSNPAIVTLAANPVSIGTGNLSITTQPGETTFVVYALGVTNAGSVTITASSSNYASASSTVTAALSGFVLAGPNGVGGSFTTGQNSTQQLTVSPAQLDSSGNVVQIQPLAGGPSVVVSLSVANPNLGSVSPSSVTFTGGVSSAATTFTAGSTVVSSTITANEPGGFSTPAANANVLDVSVTNQTLSCQSVTVGLNLENVTSCSISSTALTDEVLTLTSNDPSRLLLSADPTIAGSTSITRKIQAGGSISAPFYVYGLANSGTVTFNASVSGLNATGTVTLTQSGFVLVTPFGLGADFNATSGGAPQDVVVQTAQLDSSGNYVTTQALAGGLSAKVTVTSSNTGVGTISASPAVINGANDSATVQFQGVSSGTAQVTAVAPGGYTTPAQFATVNVTVGQPRILIDSGNTIGNQLERMGTIILVGAAAPTNGLSVTLTVTGGPLSLSTTGTDAGSGSIAVTIPAGQSSGTYYIYGLSTSGTGTVTATAPNYLSGNGTETLTPSGIVISGPGGPGFPFDTPLSSGNQPLSVSTAQFDTNGNFVEIQPLAGTASVVVNLSNTNSSAGTVPTSVTIAPGNTANGTATATFHPVATGTTIVGVSQPSGFTAPSDGTNSLTVNVQ